MTKEELLKSLLLERQDQTWWKTPPRVETVEDARWQLLLKSVDHDVRVMQALADEREAG